MMTLRSAVDAIIPSGVFGPLRHERSQRIRCNPDPFGLHSVAFVTICAMRRRNFHKLSDRVGHVIRLTSAAINSSIASITVREPHHAAP